MTATPNIFTRTTPRAPFKWIFHKGDFNWTGMTLLPLSPKTQIMIWKTYVSFGILLGYFNWLNSKSDNKSNFFPLKMQSRFREGPINFHDIWGIYSYFYVWGSELFGLALDIANGSGSKLRLELWVYWRSQQHLCVCLTGVGLFTRSYFYVLFPRTGHHPIILSGLSTSADNLACTWEKKMGFRVFRHCLDAETQRKYFVPRSQVILSQIPKALLWSTN